MKKYTLPAEWHQQQAVLLTFPDEHTIWKDTLSDIEPLYVTFARTILAYQDVVIICRNFAKQQYIQKLIGNTHTHQLRFLHAEFNDLWIRDYGPISVIEDKHIKWLDFGFNAWGGKYPGELDNKVAKQLFNAHLLNVNAYQREDYVLEGGAIETDGLGTLLVTSCVLTKTRNAHLTLEQIQQSLNMDRVIMIEHGLLLGDDTDGHVDTLVRFCDPHTLAYTSCDDPKDPHYESLKAMEAQIKTLKDIKGNPYKLIPLPIPSPKLDIDGRRLPASYANFLIINDAVLCPTYDDPNDAMILERLQTAFQDRKVIAIPSLPLIQYNGALHCASMQIPSI